MTRTPLPHHLFERDGVPVRNGGPDGCRHCPMPMAHPVHDLPSTSDDARALDARKIGEQP